MGSNGAGQGQLSAVGPLELYLESQRPIILGLLCVMLGWAPCFGLLKDAVASCVVLLQDVPLGDLGKFPGRDFKNLVAESKRTS